MAGMCLLIPRGNHRHDLQDLACLALGFMLRHFCNVSVGTLHPCSLPVLITVLLVAHECTRLVHV